MRTYTTLRFEDQEWFTPCIQVAFPALVRGDEAVKGSHRQGVRGRHLWGVCSRRGERFSAEFIHEAWSEAIDLEAVPTAESDRAYWDRELAAPSDEVVIVGRPGKGKTRAAVEAASEVIGRQAVGLIAPGTDTAGVLAEIRAGMLRDVREAIPVLTAAKQAVGPLPDPDEKDED